ncbi:serine/threonine-protein kinase [Leifsonia sp. Leaf264]|uniref:serine/threonine-protein kinase n=1 Tax=Leifsonia sp. Leaf264 TaxID=1736314 RepID=UPI00138F034D|nr:serine/threonine-protein kinase [Leifsonia sp. Leaf264]
MDSGDQRGIGRVLAGRYELVGVVGRGGMATVYRARDGNLGRFVAVKLFAAGTAIDDARRRAEVDLLARVNHPNLVSLHDAHLAPADSDEPSFIVMELVDGPDLRDVLDAEGLSGSATALLAAEIAEALAVVHAQGIVHRDLKPANILLAPTGLPSPEFHARLTDFGIAHLIGADRVTTAGTVIGTAAYLSPEQAAGGEPGSPSDIYAFGLLLLECLTGRRAYPGTVIEAMSARASRDPSIPADLPVAWASLLTQMTSRDPALRPTAIDVAAKARRDGSALAGWAGGRHEGGLDTESTAAMLEPTRLLAPVAPGAAATVGLPPSPAPAARSDRKLTVAAGALVVIGALVAGTVLAVSGASSPQEAETTPPATTTTSIPSQTPATEAPAQTVAPVDEETAEPEPEPGDGNSGKNGSGSGKDKDKDTGNGKGKGKNKE